MNTGNDSIPELIVAGAGPGDPELITIKAQKALLWANVVLYDNLINKALLDYTRPECEKIYVGKLPYGVYTPQESILEMIKEKAFSQKKVLRLKGGDPYIFGRGFEEVLYARQHGIKASYIPGVTSMQAAGLEDVPLTYRMVSESIWVVTGTKKDGSISGDLRNAMQSKATVVIYMGMKKLNDISRIYIDEGQGNMPAVVIQHASLPQSRKVYGRISEIPEKVDHAGLTHPSIIIIGPVAALALDS